MQESIRKVLVKFALIAPAPPAFADVITDWNEKAVAFVTKQRMLPPQAERVIASVHLSMFDAVNSIEPRYRPYRLAVITAKDASPEAAAAVAAGMVLVGLHPKDSEELNALMAAYLAAIPSSEAKSNGIKVGQEVAAKIVAERNADGGDAPDAYRPKTRPGVYVPTPITASSMWPKVKPFAMQNPTRLTRSTPVPMTT